MRELLNCRVHPDRVIFHPVFMYKMLKYFFLYILAAGLSATAEVGLAVDTSGQVLLFGSYCTGLKADVSMEVDVVLGQWFKIDNVIGSNFALGIGVDISEPKKATGTRERGGNIELIFNPTREFIGATLSIGYGRGTVIRNARSRKNSKMVKLHKKI